MTAATVFVDDAVLGRLPDVCVKTGVPADGTLEVRQEIGAGTRLGVLWLLALAGPIGWLVLVGLWFALRDRGEVLTVRLPLSERAHEQRQAARRREVLALVALGVMLAVLMASLVLPVSGPVGSTAQARMLALCVLGLAVTAAVAAWRASRLRVRWSVAVTLDASRRWVTLNGVHERFAALVAGQRPAFPTAAGGAPPDM